MKPGVGVGVMILKDNKILLGLRNPNKEKVIGELNEQGTWTMPGGKVEFNETIAEAGIRELKEETDLDTNNIEVISVQDDFSEGAHYVTIGLMAKEYSGEVKVMEPETIIKWEWFSFDNLPENMYLPSKQCIKKYLDKAIY